MKDNIYFPISGRNDDSVPFDSAAEAFFWFIVAQKARSEGARISAGQSLYPRPCEPVDIYKVVDRLYRQRRLDMNHLNVLRHYGVRGYAPDARRVKEMRSHKIWSEAMERIEPVLIRKGIVYPKKSNDGYQNWAQDACIFETVAAE